MKVCFLANVLGERVFCKDFDDKRSGLDFDIGFFEGLPTVDFLYVGLFVSRMMLGLWMWKYSILMGSWDLMFIRGCFFVDFDFFFYIGLLFSSTYFFALIWGFLATKLHLLKYSLWCFVWSITLTSSDRFEISFDLDLFGFVFDVILL